MRVYLDNCCYNRPFDEQAQLRVRLETEEYVWSDMRIGEVSDSPYQDRVEKILPWRDGASVYVPVTEGLHPMGC